MFACKLLQTSDSLVIGKNGDSYKSPGISRFFGWLCGQKQFENRVVNSTGCKIVSHFIMYTCLKDIARLKCNDKMYKIENDLGCFR